MNRKNLFKTQIKGVTAFTLIITMIVSFAFSVIAFGETNIPTIKLIAKEINNSNRTISVDVVVERGTKIAAASF